jgi:sugar/nucleoside kinase (ribokinase family)
MMARYDVYGVGNALVDIEYEVTPQQLSELNIEKGVMTLVDEPQQTLVVDRLGAHESHRGGGGSAANTIIAVCQLGGRGYYSCRVADDEMGHFYLSDLSLAGVTLGAERDSLPQGITGKCLVLVTPDADRTMNTFLGASADVAPEDVDPAAIAESKFLYIEGYLVTGPSSKATALYAVQEARKSGTKIAFSLSDPNIVHFFRPAIEELIGDGVDLLFANEDEAKKMAGTEDFQQSVDYLKSIAKQFVVTRGPAGAVAFDGQMAHKIEAVPTDAVDTVGAGDMFAGALLYGVTRGMDFPGAGRLASMAASRIVSSLGPRLSGEELQQVLQQFRDA